MGRAKPVVLTTQTFAKQGDAHQYFKAMLKRYKPGDRVTEDDGRDLASLLDRHPSRDEKVGSGIDHFEVAEDLFSTQCFRVVRTDDTAVNFSYPKCVAPDTKS